MIVLYLSFFTSIGLRLWVGEEMIKEFDIAEAPFSLLRMPDSNRLKPLDVAYKFSASKCMDPHIRCHYLTSSDDITHLMGETSIAVVAVIFVNLSNSLSLSETFLAPDFQTQIPLYILSQEDGDYISKNIDDITECRILTERAETTDSLETVDSHVCRSPISKLVIGTSYSAVMQWVPLNTTPWHENG